MLDIKLIRETPELVRKNLEKRNDKEKLSWLHEIIDADKEWRQLNIEVEKLRHSRNKISKEINEAKKQGKDVSELLEQAKIIPEMIKEKEQRAVTLKERIDYILMRLPNILHESVPIGKDESDNVVARKVGRIQKYKFPVKDHIDVALGLNLVDLERAAKIAGSRFFFLKGELVLLDLALMRYALDFMHKKKFTPVLPPFMMRRGAYEGVVDLADFENVLYKVENEDLYLIATSEHPLTAQYMNETLEVNKLPIKLTGFSTNFRKEAGAHGKDTKGIFRVHQFNKVEQIVICHPKESWKWHEQLLKNAEDFMKSLGLPYRVIKMCSAETGMIAAKKYDIEVWMPAQKTYREVVSCSNCTDYQARRLNMRYQHGNERGIVHTLNSTLVPDRALVAILENFQQKDGSVKIPKVLHKYMNGIKELRIAEKEVKKVNAKKEIKKIKANKVIKKKVIKKKKR